MANTYKVSICGKTYTLVSEDNKDYTEKLAAALDKRIREMKRNFATLSVTDCAVLTALDCMDELGQATRNVDNIRSQIKEYVDDAGRARNQAAAAQREIKALQEKVEALEKELNERTNYAAVSSENETVSAEDILSKGIEQAISNPAERSREQAGIPQPPVKNIPENTEKITGSADKFSNPAEADELSPEQEEAVRKHAEALLRSAEAIKKQTDTSQTAGRTSHPKNKFNPIGTVNPTINTKHFGGNK